jgi:hypothetical protein
MNQAYAYGARLAQQLLHQQAPIGADVGGCPVTDSRPPSVMKALLHITLPDGDGDGETAEERHFAPIWLALNAMAGINEWHIRRALKRAARGGCPPIPPLLASGVYYKEDPPGEENWKDCYAVLRDGHGDCDRLIAWRVAELRVAGIAAEPVIKWQRIPREMMIAIGHPASMVPADGIDMVHCMVRFPDGRIEDTSRLLGMGGNYTSAI